VTQAAKRFPVLGATGAVKVGGGLFRLPPAVDLRNRPASLWAGTYDISHELLNLNQATNTEWRAYDTMHVTPEVVRCLESAWGTPATADLSYPMGVREWGLVAHSAERRRTHDVTPLIPRHGALAVIQKRGYPSGVWRTPSGGVAPGEGFEDGAVREAWEETGVRVEPSQYLLRARVRFTRGSEHLVWWSHVFQMRYLAGEPHPMDIREIAAARWADLEELAGPVHQVLTNAGSGGFLYRDRLQDLAAPLLIGGKD